VEGQHIGRMIAAKAMKTPQRCIELRKGMALMQVPIGSSRSLKAKGLLISSMEWQTNAPIRDVSFAYSTSVC
jgi:hypothetical protein